MANLIRILVLSPFTHIYGTKVERMETGTYYCLNPANVEDREEAKYICSAMFPHADFIYIEPSEFLNQVLSENDSFLLPTEKTEIPKTKKELDFFAPPAEPVDNFFIPQVPDEPKNENNLDVATDATTVEEASLELKDTTEACMLQDAAAACGLKAPVQSPQLTRVEYAAKISELGWKQLKAKTETLDIPYVNKAQAIEALVDYYYPVA